MERSGPPRRRSPLGRGGGLGAALLLVLGFAGSPSGAADAPGFQVIVNAAHRSDGEPRDLVSDLFLKRVSRWDSGEPVRPVDLAADSEVRRTFSSRVLDRSVAVVRAYWEQRIFSGRDVPPPEMASDEEVVRFVARYPGAIGYVSPSARLEGVKVLAVR